MTPDDGLSYVRRAFWEEALGLSWAIRPILWLQGPRRTGKTTLSKHLPGAAYFNCDLPSVQRASEDPEAFLAGKAGALVLDEIHQLRDPGTLLKIAADEHPSLRVLATGSSTLVADGKFSDSLTGRKRNLVFTPVLPLELKSFGKEDIGERLLRGGCPPALLADRLDPDFYAEWLDSFYARDIQKIFSVEKRQPFLDALVFLMSRNGGLLDVSELAKEAGLSRPTAARYLDILDQAQAVRVVRPWAQKDDREYKAISKVYGFDTGFVCFAKGIDSLRPDDCGPLLENLTLDTMLAHLRPDQILYWRTKDGHEVDFVIREGSALHAVEVKWRARQFSPKALARFRSLYPKGKNLLVTGEPGGATKMAPGGIPVEVTPIRVFHESLPGLRAKGSGKPAASKRRAAD